MPTGKNKNQGKNFRLFRAFDVGFYVQKQPSADGDLRAYIYRLRTLL